MVRFRANNQLATNDLPVSLVAKGAQRAVIWEETLKRQRTEQEMQLTLSSTRALLFPIMASAALLLMFYFFSAFSIVMYFSAAFGSFSGIYFTLVPLLDMLSPSLAKRTIKYGRLFFHCGLCSHDALLFVIISIPYSIQTVTVQQAILGTVAGLSVAIWMLTGSFFLNNSSSCFICPRDQLINLHWVGLFLVLGIGYSVLALGFVKVPNLKISVLILTLLFIYDIFWVFYSANFFGTSVMVAVATKAATNPLHTVAGAVGLQDNVAAELQLPMKLIFGDHILGLGDIVLPGLILVFLLKYDTFKVRKSKVVFDMLGAN
jgi:hypothetical protein